LIRTSRNALEAYPARPGFNRQGSSQIMKILKSALVYFLVVFAAGLVMGTIRTLWIVPRTGARAAELMEAPIMLVVSFLTARWVVQRLAVPSRLSARLGMGFAALGLMLLAEFSLVLWVRGLSFREYLATRDPVSGTVYYLLLLVFAFMPMLVVRR
jgi:hypothetical protein